MELREFAEIILYGNDLTRHKLLQPGVLTDEYPGEEIIAPVYPGRPKLLDFERAQAQKKVDFPSQNEIEKERQRGHVLHFFANHELLALELMALALLKFPNAPKNFRMGIARTILEEQKHMTMYQKRMEEFGVEFGEIPVNDFFWKCLSHMSSPMDYVTKLSMTFEQANLDFSYFYMKLMEKIGDKETAQILKTVYEEEIGHVKHGVAWFDKWRDPHLTQWQSYVNSLKLPLTPARAKGIIFDRKSRIHAGLSDDYLNELYVFSSSKGRPPDVFYFNPACELEVSRGKIGYNPVESVRLLQQDLSSLCLFLAAQDDIVLTHKKPGLEFLTTLKDCGFDLPQWYELKNNKVNIDDFEQNCFGSLKPWGWSVSSFEMLKPFIEKSKKYPENFESFSKFFSKDFSAQLTIDIVSAFQEYENVLTKKEHLPVKVTKFYDVLVKIQELQKNFQTVVLKLPFGTAGQNMLRVQNFPLLEKEKNWIENNLEKYGFLIIEPWFDRVADFSSQLKIEENQVVYLGETRLLTDNRGQYFGTLIGKKIDYLSEDVVKFLYTQLSSRGLIFRSLLKEVSLFVADKLKVCGFEGAFGIDVFIYRDTDSPLGFRIKFISEINPRFTMGRVALEISKRVVPGVCSLWIHLRLKDIEKQFGSKSDFYQLMKSKFPLEIVNTNKPQIKRGVLFTNDLSQSNSVVSLLVCGGEYCAQFLSLVHRNI